MATNRQTIKVRSERVVLKTSSTIIRTAQATSAIDVSISDAGNYYTSIEVEGALQEVGATNEGQDASIVANTADIATNTAGIATNVAGIASNTVSIASNVADIATNTADIATNATDIASNTANIADNTSDIATNTANIAANTADIATNVSGIASNDTEILELQSRGLQEVTDVGGVTDNDIDAQGNISNQSYSSPQNTISFAQPTTDYNIDSVTGSQTAVLTLTGNTTLQLTNLTATADPSTLVIEVLQDNVGSHVLTFNPASIGDVDVTQVLSDPNSITIYVLVRCSDGKYRGSGKTFGA